MKRILLIVFCLLVSVGNVSAYSSPGSPIGYVNDFAGVLSADTKQQIESRLSSLDASTSAQISVVTIKSLDGDSLENYAEKLFAEWGIGKKGKDNGVLLLVAVDEREVRIEVGYGLEGALTDAESFWIIRDKITPRFKEGDYNQGVIDGVEGILSAAAEDLNVVDGMSASTVDEVTNAVMGIIFFVIPVSLWFVSILARSKSWWAGGVIGGFVGALVWGMMGLMLLGLFGLLLDWLVSREYKKSTASGSYPWWIGGKSGFGSGGGGRSGGFGGFGGGRSGGGGASGRW